MSVSVEIKEAGRVLLSVTEHEVVTPTDARARNAAVVALSEVLSLLVGMRLMLAPDASEETADPPAAEGGRGKGKVIAFTARGRVPTSSPAS